MLPLPISAALAISLTEIFCIFLSFNNCCNASKILSYFLESGMFLVLSKVLYILARYLKTINPLNVHKKLP